MSHFTQHGGSSGVLRWYGFHCRRYVPHYGTGRNDQVESWAGQFHFPGEEWMRRTGGEWQLLANASHTRIKGMRERARKLSCLNEERWAFLDHRAAREIKDAKWAGIQYLGWMWDCTSTGVHCVCRICSMPTTLLLVSKCSPVATFKLCS